MKAKFLNVKSLFDSKQHTLEFRDFKARALTKEACYELLKEALEESFLKEGKVVTATVSPCEGGADVKFESDSQINYLNLGVK